VNTNQLYVDTSTGNVGVGDATPSYTLQIENATTPILSIGDGLGNVAGERVSGTLFFNTNQTGTTTSDIRAAIKGIVTDYNNTTGLTFHTSNASSLGTERMRITSDGNVGIGTTTPVGKLVVSNAGAQGLEFLPNATYGETIQAYNRSGAVFTNLALISAQTIFRNASAETMRIDSSGNLIVSDLSGSGNRCVYADSTGQINVKGFDCGSASGGDNLGDHTATQNILLGANWLSSD